MPRRPSKPLLETNGAILTASNPIAGVTKLAPSVPATAAPDFDTIGKDKSPNEGDTATASKTELPSRQTHGASFVRGPITSVQQLIGLRNVAKGSMGSFETIGAYRNHINKLTLGDLHSHAVESQVTPIHDRDRLIKRLESEWTTVASRNPGRGAGVTHPLSTPEKDEKMRGMLKEMLNRR